MRLRILSGLLLACLHVYSQDFVAPEFHMAENATDSFTVGIGRLLNAAPLRFKSVQGPLLRSTALMGYDYQLLTTVPGSTLGIVRVRDWDCNVYIEFRGYATQQSIDSGMLQLANQLRRALGLQQEMNTGSAASSLITTFNIPARGGYFEAGIELMAGRSAANPYLSGPENDPDSTAPKEAFILLKIHSGTPGFRGVIPQQLESPLPRITTAVSKLLTLAQDDFKNMSAKKDTLMVEGLKVVYNGYGQHHFATILLPGLNGDGRLQYAKAVAAALGNSYDWYVSGTEKANGTLLFLPRSADYSQPVFYLEERDGQWQLQAQSRIGHEVPRAMKRD